MAELRLERVFDAAPDRVFDAWVDPELLRRWWAAGPDWETPLAEADARPGGRYRLSMRNPESGETHTVGGEYRQVERPNRLVYTWKWEDGDGTESLVTVDFAEAGEGTRVVLEHTGLGSDDSAAQHEHGWKACMDNLERRAVLAAA